MTFKVADMINKYINSFTSLGGDVPARRELKTDRFTGNTEGTKGDIA